VTRPFWNLNQRPISSSRAMNCPVRFFLEALAERPGAARPEFQQQRQAEQGMIRELQGAEIHGRSPLAQF
jgi:hypothetical protein